MYERGSDQMHDLSYGSVYSAANGAANGVANGYSGNGHSAAGQGAEDPLVWYRSPSGEPTDAAPAQPWYATPGHTTPSYTNPGYTGPSYDNTAYDAAYATQSFPAANPAVPPAPATGTDITTQDAPIVYPMRNVAGRMAMVLGIIAILFTSILFPLYPLAFFFGIGAIMLGRRGRLRARYGFASNPGSAGGGFALGVLSIVLVAVWSGLTAWVCLTYSATDMKNCVQHTHNAPEAIRCVADVVQNS